MCGLIAVVGTVPSKALSRAVHRAGARGPHSSRWATDRGLSDPRRGPLRLSAMPEPAHADVVLGHSRLATDSAEPGADPSPLETQPVRGRSWVLAHNGTAPWLQGSRAPRDTRALLSQLEQGGPDALLDRQLYGGRPQALLMLSPVSRRLIALRIDGARTPAHPLYSTAYASGVLLSSAPVDDASELLPAGELHTYEIGEPR